MRCLVLLIVALAVPASAAEKVTDTDRFRLWNDCEPIMLFVRDLPNDLGSIGLKTDLVEFLVRGKMQDSRIFTEGAWAIDPETATASPSISFLLVRVSGGRLVQLFDIEFIRWLRGDHVSFKGRATTWSLSGMGAYGDNAGHILSVIAELTDRFIEEYLRVNEAACRKSN